MFVVKEIEHNSLNWMITTLSEEYDQLVYELTTNYYLNYTTQHRQKDKYTAACPLYRT